MIPQKSDARWLRLIKGEVNHKFKNVAAGLMLARLNRQLSSNFGAVASEKCVDELYEFFKKYEGILEDDINAIFG